MKFTSKSPLQPKTPIEKFDDPVDAAIREQHRLSQHVDTDQLILFVRGQIDFADAVLERWGRGPSIKDVKEREAYELHHWNRRCYWEILRRLENG